MLRWIGKNISTLVMAILLALVVWVSAVLSADPIEDRVYPRQINLEVIGLDAGLVQVENIPTQVRVTLKAPQSIWNRLTTTPDNVRAWIDLSGYGKGEHTVEVQAQVTELSPVQVVKIEPEQTTLRLEALETVSFPVHLSVAGDPALGYRVGEPTLEPAEVKVVGPESMMARVAAVRTDLDISGASETVQIAAPLAVVDQEGNTVPSVTVTPAVVQITQPITLLGGYRNVVVKVMTIDQVAEGYWLTNISVSPPNVTVFSTNPQAVDLLPGFVETNPISLNGLSDDVDIRVTLNLPEGVSLAGEESVLVRLSIAAREGSLPITLPIETIGLSPELEAILSPETVDLLLTGPLPILNNLNAAGIRVSVDLSGLEPGTYQLPAVVDLLPNEVNVASMMPEGVEVIIQLAPTPTPTPRGEGSSSALLIARSIPVSTPSP